MNTASTGKVPRVLVVETSRSLLKRAVDLIEGMGLFITAVEEDQGVKEATSGNHDVIIVGLPGGEEVVSATLARGMDRPSVIVTVAPSEKRPSEAAAAISADTAVHRPLKRDEMGLALRTAMLLRKARRRIAELERKLIEERRLGRATGGADPRTGFYPFEQFKRLLMMELKRAKRYQYSLAVALVALDPVKDASNASAAEIKPDVRSAMVEALAGAVSQCIRDIDVPVDYADERFLVFLPYTDLGGAERVGRRIVDKIRRGMFREGERTLRVSASVGVAAQRPGGEISFAALIRDAMAALKAARLKGGDRVVVRGAKSPDENSQVSAVAPAPAPPAPAAAPDPTKPPPIPPAALKPERP